jgi:hypothetical protein
MPNPNRYAANERRARSRLAQLLHDHELIKGSLVTMTRECGKEGCRCTRGEKHVSQYLSVKIDGKRRMLYVPGDMVKDVRRRVEAYREVERLTETVSNACVARVLEQKRKRKDNG